MTGSSGPGLVPDKLRDLVLGWLCDEQGPAFASVATVENGSPRLRTVHWRYVAEADKLAFNTHTASPKWAQLCGTPEIQGCCWYTARSVQMRWGGAARLLRVMDRLDQADAGILRRMWSVTPEPLRCEYWRVHQPASPRTNLEAVCPTFSTVLVTPSLWDIYYFDPHAYQLHERRRYHVSRSGNWTEEAIRPLDSHRV